MEALQVVAAGEGVRLLSGDESTGGGDRMRCAGVGVWMRWRRLRGRKEKRAGDNGGIYPEFEKNVRIRENLLYTKKRDTGRKKGQFFFSAIWLANNAHATHRLLFWISGGAIPVRCQVPAPAHGLSAQFVARPATESAQSSARQRSTPSVLRPHAAVYTEQRTVRS